jgi:ATP-binding cassette subfamily B protein
MTYKRSILIGLLSPLGIILMNIIAPLYIGKTLGALALPSGQPMRYLLVFAAAGALGLICNRVGHPLFVTYQALVARDLQDLGLTTLLRRSVGFHNNNIGGKLVSDAIDFPNAYQQLMNAITASALPLAITLLMGTAIIYTESWILGLMITTMTAAIIGLGVRDSIRMQPRRQARLAASKAVTAHLADTVTNIQTTKTFGREDYELAEHARLGNNLADIRVADWRLMSIRGNARLIILFVFQAAFVLVTIWLVRRNPALLGMGIFAFTLTVTLSNRLFEVNLLIRNVEEALLQAAPMTNIILETPEILDRPDAEKLRVTGGHIVLQDVTFGYQDNDSNQAVFSHLSLDIKPGEKVGLVGPSGGGKSTFTRLLLRFEDIADGQITIDGQNIAAVTQKSLRRAVAYVPQEPLLFHRSIAENIAYGQPQAGAAAVKKAAQLAHAHDFINELPKGYDTVVGERGVKLSGGQRQRVAIARAILKDAPLLILDEATSALDSESEVLIQDALWQLMKGRTAIVIAHRLSTIQKMDRIVVLEDGKITEEGTHKQLIKQNGTYARLWAHQSGGFLES